MDTIVVGHLVARPRNAPAPVRVTAGRGTGTECGICTQLITPADVQYEVDSNPGADGPTQCFHLECFRDWWQSRQHQS